MRGFGTAPGDASPGDTNDRPIDRTSDRPIDRSIRVNTPHWTWFSTGSNVAYRLLRQPRGHIKARIQEACRRRVTRRHARSTDRPNDPCYYSRLGKVFCLLLPLEPHRGSTHRIYQEAPKGYRATRKIDRSSDRPIDRSTDRTIDRSIRFNTPLWTRFSTGPNVAYRLLRQPRRHIKVGPGSQRALM